MIGWVVRILLIVAGGIASWFVARDALHFEIIQMTIAILLFTLIIIIAAFWSAIKDWLNRNVRR